MMAERAKDAAVHDTVDAVMSRALGDALRDQQLRQERLRHVQEFLSSPVFLDLGQAPLVVLDDAPALAEHRRDLSYRIAVLQSVLAILTEERDLLDSAVPVTSVRETGTDPQA